MGSRPNIKAQRHTCGDRGVHCDGMSTISTQTGAPPAAKTAPPSVMRAATGDTVRVVPKHHVLVRLTHWVNVPVLLGLIASGLAIYWASPVFKHPRDPVTGSRDYFVDAGLAIARLLGDTGVDRRYWLYNHLSIGPQQLAISLRLHWAMAYLFMLNGLLYVVGLA